MRSNVRLLAPGVLALLVGLGCYPERGQQTSYDSIFTVRDTTTDFGTAVTFAMADSVVHLGDPGDPDNITRAYDDDILARVRLNMVQAGYTEVLDPATSDLNVVTLVSSSEFTGYYWDYWCSYYGWWYGAWGCYYPPYWYSYSYEVGTILIGISDQRRFLNDHAPMVWFAAANGLMGTGATLARITSAIDQAFDQSPYISAN